MEAFDQYCELTLTQETLYTEFQPDFQYEVYKSGGLIKDSI